VYSKPANTTASPNTTIESAKYNATIDDLVADANTARPIVAGGTGATSVTAAQTSLSLDNKVVYSAKSANYTALATDNNAVLRFTAAATLSLTAVATLGANWHVTVIADGGDVTIDPNASETIDGATTVVIPNGYSALVVSNGSAFFTDKMWSIVQPKATMTFGQCQLALSGGNLRLGRLNGQLLTINGAHYSIPSAGVTLAATGLTPGTAYYIYAYMNSGTMTLEASTTVPVADTTTGMQIKTGDATRALVGLWMADTGPTWSTIACQGASWFNPVPKMSAGAVASPNTTSTASLTELATNARLDFVTFAERPARIEIAGRAGVSIAQQDIFVTASVDTVGILPNQVAMRNGNTTSGDQTPFFSGAYYTATAGKHTAGILAAVGGGATATFPATNVIVTISG